MPITIYLCGQILTISEIKDFILTPGNANATYEVYDSL